MSPAEARSGVTLISKLTQLGIGLHELENFVETSKKLAERTDFEPNQVIQAAMALSNLESESGKSYPEALQDFEAKTRRNERLKEKNRQLEKERKQKLAQSKITEGEIDYNMHLRQNLQRYGVTLDDAERLLQYLENMRETNEDPKQFIKYTEKFGSLERRLNWLENQERLKEDVLNTQEDQIEHQSNAIKNSQAELSTLQDKIGNRKQIHESLQQQDDEIQERIQQQLRILSGLLEVETEGKTIKEALDSQTEKLNTSRSKCRRSRTDTSHSRAKHSRS